MKETTLEMQNVEKVSLKNIYSFLNVNFEDVQELFNKQLYTKINEGVYHFLDKRHVSIYWKDKEGNYLGANKYMVILAGCSNREEIIGKTNHQIILKDQAETLDAIDQKIISTGQTIVVEEQVNISKTNKTQYFLSTKKPYYNENGEIIGILGVSIDITTQKEAERILKQEQEKNKAALLLVGSLAHDSKNDVHFIGLHAEYLQMVSRKIKKYGPLHLSPRDWEVLYSYPQKIMDRTSAMNKKIKFTNQYVRDLSLDVDISGKYQQVQSMRKFVQEVMQEYAHDETLNIHNLMKGDFQFLGEPIGMYKILGNIMGNAQRQIQEKGRGEIFISQGEDEKYNILKIKDSAGSVNKEQIQQIFTAYLHKQSKGTGFGLSSATVLMRGMKGKLEAHLVDDYCIEFLLFFPKI
jgi:PAS domain S-box-containing protein